jgi:hypothetical protein
LYRVTNTSEQGLFVLRNVPPGTYKLFAFQEIGPFEWLDTELQRTVDGAAELITVGPGETLQRDLTAISPEALLPGR